MTKEWKVLLAEDSADDRLLISRAVKTLGGAKLVSSLEDGQEVIAYLKGEGAYGDRENYPLPDVLLLDLKMPRMGGFEVLQWIQQHKTGELIVCILSSSEVPEEMARARSLGARLYLVKSYNMSDTLRPIRPLLSG